MHQSQHFQPVETGNFGLVKRGTFVLSNHAISECENRQFHPDVKKGIKVHMKPTNSSLPNMTTPAC